MQPVIFKDLGIIDYKTAWDLQEKLLKENVAIKSASRLNEVIVAEDVDTRNYFLLCEHTPVYTLGKSGNMDNVLLGENELKEQQIEFFPRIRRFKRCDRRGQTGIFCSDRYFLRERECKRRNLTCRTTQTMIRHRTR